MWIKCLAEGQKCQALTGIEPGTLWSRVKGSLQYTIWHFHLFIYMALPFIYLCIDLFMFVLLVMHSYSATENYLKTYQYRSGHSNLALSGPITLLTVYGTLSTNVWILSIFSFCFFKTGNQKTPWSRAETQAVWTFFSDNIKEEKVPGKESCDCCLRKNSCLKNRTWKDVKYKVKNTITSCKRSKRH